MKYLYSLLIIFYTSISIGQSFFQIDQEAIFTGNFKIGPATANDASAVFEIESTTQGLLPPRMDTTARDNISSPATALTIFNTSTVQWEFFDSSVWVAIGGGAGGTVSGTGTDNRISRWDGTADIQDSNISLADTTGDLQNETSGQDWAFSTIIVSGATNGGDISFTAANSVDGIAGSLNFTRGIESGSGTNGQINFNGEVVMTAEVLGTTLQLKADSSTIGDILDISNNAGTKLWFVGGTGNIQPNVDNTIAWGASNKRFANGFWAIFTADTIKIGIDGTSGEINFKDATETNPNSKSTGYTIKNINTDANADRRSLGIFTVDENSTGGTPTGALNLGTGGKTNAGSTAVTGDTNIYTGPSSGSGAQGFVTIQKDGGLTGVGTALPVVKLEVSEASGTFGGAIGMGVTTSIVGFYYATAVGSQTCTTTCEAEDANAGFDSASGLCQQAWTSAAATSTCGTSAANQKCLCAGAK